MVRPKTAIQNNFVCIRIPLYIFVGKILKRAHRVIDVNPLCLERLHGTIIYGTVVALRASNSDLSNIT